MLLNKLYYIDDIYKDRVKLRKSIDSAIEVIDIHDINTLNHILSYRIKVQNVFVCELQVLDLKPFEVISLIKDKNPENIVIIFTDKGSEDLASQALLNGADFYFKKTTDNYDKFVSILTNYLSKKQLTSSSLNSSSIRDKEITFLQKPDGTFIYLSPSVYNVFGYKPEELLTKSVYDFIHPDDLNKVKNDIHKQLLGGNEADKVVYRIKHKNGKYLFVESDNKPILGEDKTIKEFYSESRDISHTILNETNFMPDLKNNGTDSDFNYDRIKDGITSDLKLTSIYEDSPYAVIIFDQAAMQQLDANEAALKLYGYSKEEFLNIKFTELSLEPEKTYINIHNYTEGNKVFVPIRYHKNKQGRIFPVEITTTFVHHSKRIIVFAAIKDLTQQLSSYYALSENEKKFKLIFENSIDAICVIKEGIHQIANNAYLELLGYKSNDSLYGTNIVDFVADEEKDRIISFIQSRVQRKPAPQRYETIALTRDGSKFLAEINVSTYIQDNELYSILIVRDTTKQKEADRALLESESRFRKVFENTLNIPVFGINREHIVIYWNKASEVTYGYTYYEAIGKKVEEILYPTDSKSIVYNGIEDIFTENKDEFPKESCLKKKNGGLIYVYTNQVLISNSNDEKEIYSIQTDLSEIKNAENKLRQLSSAVEQNPTSIMITDINGNIEYVNPKFEQVTGYSYAEVIGKNPRILKSGEKPAEEYISLWKDILEGREWRGELHNKKKNNELFWESAFISPIKDEKGNITHFLAIKEDITEKKHQEEAIINSEAQFRSVWESSFDAMRLTDSEGVVLKVNDAYCSLVGLPREKLEGYKFANIYVPANYDHSISKFIERFETHNFQNQFETEMELWNGKKVWVELSNSLININGKESLLLSIFRNISDRKNQQLDLISSKEKAEEVSRLKSNFLNNMSHEIRTPMVGILGFSQILYSEIDSPELREFVEEIIKSGNRMMNTINSILDLSRIEANKLELKITTINLLEEIKEVVKPLKAIAEQNDLYFVIRSKVDEIVIAIDKHMLSQIVNNLVGNAIKYTRIGGIIIELDIIAKENTDWVVLKIIDSGIGIPKESLNIIFEEFRQVSEGLNRQFEGTGLGLTITKRIVELLDGYIEVNSTVGTGSEFIVYFPLPEREHNEPVIKEELKLEKDMDFRDINQSNDPGLPQVLLVENDSVNRTVMTLFLNKTCKLDLAENGESSVEMAKKKNYAAVLMDINLGTGMNGTEAAQAIKKIPGYEDTPIVAVTAYAMVGDKEKFLDAGCTHYISKPFDKETLVTLVKTVMQK